ncbi:carbonic anhydrase 1-like [Dysidea avara]|uniref:carbonic anhydrase 1-like n=1 Tax=Dysidea avara TaxID=196820 RepID=UPI003318D16B
MLKAVALLLLFCSACCVQARTDVGPIFNYTDQDSWSANPDWTCNGSVYMRQSPIDIITADVVRNRSLMNLQFAGYDRQWTGNWTNVGRNMRFITGDHNISMTNHLGTYNWAQFHFHWGPNSTYGSEHTINGQRFAGEIHHAFLKRDGASTDEDYINVIGVFLEVDDSMPLTGSWLTLFNNIRNESQGVARVTVTPSEFLPTDPSYYYYAGAQVSPPCHETVHFFIMRSTLTVPTMWLERLRHIESFEGPPLVQNLRVVQPSYNRRVSTQDSGANGLGSSLGLLILVMVVRALY